MDSKRAYRRFKRAMKIKSRIKDCGHFKHMPTGMIADTPKPYSSPTCCGNRRTTEGLTIQELKNIDPKFAQVINEEFWNIL